MNLPNNCHCSKMTVNPRNWNTKKASLKTPWYFSYRFYGEKVKQVQVKGMNEFKVLADRQAATRKLLENEVTMLLEGYNPITGITQRPTPEVYGDITPYTPLLTALRLTMGKLTFEPSTVCDMKSVMKYFEISTLRLKKNIPLKEVRRKDIRLILENCATVKKRWSNNQFNHYRKYLSILFSELEQMEIIEYNPVEKIAKKETVQRVRVVLSDDERKLISEHLSKARPDFYRFINIFFHSGSRNTELMRLKGSDVDLTGQRFKVLIKKGRRQREVWKTIKTIAMPFWIEQMKGCNENDYVFSRGLRPGVNAIRFDQVKRRWRTHVKKALGVRADFYSLKHLNTSEVVDQLDEQAAASLNAHTGTGMVIKIYDVKQKDRQHNRLKGVNNSF